jgi:NAD(P)-dependent dehydrogenase (short-subunit alcohol dehydrogenase family)
MDIPRPQRDDRLKGKVAIVTGAGSRGDGIGNGRAAAVLLARHGARVALVDIDADAVEETARLIAAEGGVTQIYDGDVSDRASCEAIVERTVEGFGRLDILVNNVGLTGPRGDAIEVDDIAWDSAMRINVASMMLMAKYAIPEMMKSGGGSIINLTSIAGLRGGHPSLLYPTSKSAVIGLTRAMAAHHGRGGIRVNCIAPGTVYTPMVASRGMSAEMRRRHRLGYRLWRVVSGQRRSALDHGNHARHRWRCERRSDRFTGAAERAAAALMRLFWTRAF